MIKSCSLKHKIKGRGKRKRPLPLCESGSQAGESGHMGPVSSLWLQPCCTGAMHPVSSWGLWSWSLWVLHWLVLHLSSPQRACGAMGRGASLRVRSHSSSQQRTSMVLGGVGVCSLLMHCVCGFCWVCGSVGEYMSVFLDMCMCCVAVLWFNKAFIYIAAMKSCHQVT